MTQWEYKIINDWEHGDPDSEFELNELGNYGWELVHVQDVVVKIISSGPLTGKCWYFKRPVKKIPRIIP